MRLRYGTRGSALALAQSDQVAQAVEKAAGVRCERVVIQTSGDRFSAAPAKDVGAAPNVKAMFVKEIEDALLKGSIDFAVHSTKDIPGTIPEGLCLAAFPVRADPRDVFIGNPKVRSLSDLPPGTIVATSSLRRRIQLAIARPGIAFATVRGNVDTRLGKLATGEFAGIVLAKAGIARLGRADIPHEVIPLDVVVPAPGQGALALEARVARKDVLGVLAHVNDPATALAVECEREFLKAMGGGCQTPLGAYAQPIGDRLRLSVFWSDADGRRPIRRSAEGAAEGAAMHAWVRALAAEVLEAAS